VVIALLLLGCGLASGGEPVALTTGEQEFPENPGGATACITYFNVGLLIRDANFGTAARTEDGIHPLIWPPGYTARRLASGDVVVLSGSGGVVATTGRKYQFWTGNWGSGNAPVHTGNTGCVNPYS